MSNQEAFLNQIAGKLGRQRKSGVKPPDWDLQPYLHLYEGKDHEQLIQEFIQNIQQLNVEVDRTTPDHFHSSLKKVIEKHQIHSSVIWDDPSLTKLQVSQSLSALDVETTIWDANGNEQDLRNTAAHCDLGITWADMGLSETGTVVLWNGGGRGRLVSLLPPVYLCILPESKIVPRLTQAVHYIHNQVDNGLPACINLITGPSRTGDIEMDLALGVHGPGKVHLILLKE